jgi:hypothetical protein
LLIFFPILDLNFVRAAKKPASVVAGGLGISDLSGRYIRP